MVDVAAGVVVGPRRDQQDADRRGNHSHAEALGARQAPPDPRRFGALEEVAAAVVQQFPGQAEQERGGFAGDGGFGLGRTGPGTTWHGCAGFNRTSFERPGFERGIHLHGEATPGLVADPRPGIHHVRGVGQGQRHGVQLLAPLHQLLLHLMRSAFEIGARPDRVVLQIPAQIARFERSGGRDQPPALGAVHARLAWRGGFVDQPGPGRGAAHAIALLELEVGEFEHELLQRLGLRLRQDGHVGGIALAQGHEDWIDRRLNAAGITAERDVNRLLAEEFLQHPEPGAIEGKRNNGELLPAALLAKLERVAQLLAHPLRLQRSRAHHHGKGRRGFDRLLNLRPKRIATAQLARIDPAFLAVIGQRGAEIAHERVVR